MRTYRASSLGSCTKAQVALQLGYSPLPTSEKMQTIYDRGNVHEDECVVAMVNDGWKFVGPPAEQRDEGQWYIELPVAGAKITGHLDGRALTPVAIREVLVEIKSPVSWAKWEKAHKTGDYTDPLMNRYAWQISVYMAATGLEAVIACVEDGRVKTFGVEVAPHSLEDIKQRVGLLEKFVQSSSLLDCSQADYPCPVAYLHEKAETVEDEVLDALVHVYDGFVADEKRAKAGKDEARKALLARLGDAEKMETAHSKVTRFTTARGTLDKDDLDIFLTEHGARLSDFEKRSESESIRVTKKKVDDQPSL